MATRKRAPRTRKPKVEVAEETVNTSESVTSDTPQETASDVVTPEVPATTTEVVESDKLVVEKVPVIKEKKTDPVKKEVDYPRKDMIRAITARYEDYAKTIKFATPKTRIDKASFLVDLTNTAMKSDCQEAYRDVLNFFKKNYNKLVPAVILQGMYVYQPPVVSKVSMFMNVMRALVDYLESGRKKQFPFEMSAIRTALESDNLVKFISSIVDR